MSDTLRNNGLLALKTLAALAFLAAGMAKLAGVEMMIATFEAIGVGQWFRYVTGVIEVVGAITLFIPGVQAFGAALLTATMIGAAVSHILILGTDTILPSIVLGVFTAIITYAHRNQLPIGTTANAS